MSVLQSLLLTFIFALLGVRIGWSTRTGLLLPLAVATFGAALLATSHLVATIGLTLALNAFAQCGFAIGILTSATRIVSAVLEQQQDQLV